MSEVFAPGVVVVVRDEEWLVTQVEETGDGLALSVHGLSELVRGQDAVFYPSLDDVKVSDPRRATVRADDSPRYRRSRLWLESTLRKTPVPLGDDSLTVSRDMLAQPLSYQQRAVTQALDPSNLQPRLLLADAVGLGKTLEVGLILAELIRRGRRGTHPGGHTPPRAGADAARVVDAVRHPVCSPRFAGCCTGAAEATCQPQPVCLFPTGHHLHRHP